MNKFTGIIYPFFGIKHKPWNVYFDKTKIQLQKTFTGHYETVDDKSLIGGFARFNGKSVLRYEPVIKKPIAPNKEITEPIAAALPIALLIGYPKYLAD